MLIFQQPLFPGFLQFHILPDGDVLHLRGDNALAGVMHLGDVPAGFGTQRFALIHKPQRVELRIFHAAAGEF